MCVLGNCCADSYAIATIQLKRPTTKNVCEDLVAQFRRQPSQRRLSPALSCATVTGVVPTLSFYTYIQLPSFIAIQSIQSFMSIPYYP
jgi:hypothetical protein